MNKTLEQCIVESLDGSNSEILPFLPYILQDMHEIGADPETMLELTQKHLGQQALQILDLGCGKGAISVYLASKLHCTITGIDALPEFIADARQYARQLQVSDRCTLWVGDIRQELDRFQNFNLAILGAIGPLLGPLFDTLQKLRSTLIPQGYVLLDDAWLDDDSPCTYQRCLRKSEFYHAIREAGYLIIEEVLFEREGFHEADKHAFEEMQQRVEELKLLHPEKAPLFETYLQNQAYEYEILTTQLVTGTWLLQKQAK